MKSRQVRNSLLLVLTAFIWGVAFVAQRQGGDAVGPFSFNGIRSLIGGAVLIPVIFIIDRVKPSDRKPSNRSDRKRLVIGGICCGTVLFLASSAQQLGLYKVSLCISFLKYQLRKSLDLLSQRYVCEHQFVILVDEGKKIVFEIVIALPNYGRVSNRHVGNRDHIRAQLRY